MENPQPTAQPEPEERSWSRALLLRELEKSLSPYRYEWIGSFLWPLAAICGVISYRGFLSHGWAAVTWGFGLLAFNFAVSAIVNQVVSPLRRRVAVLSELASQDSEL